MVPCSDEWFRGVRCPGEKGGAVPNPVLRDTCLAVLCRHRPLYNRSVSGGEAGLLRRGLGPLTAAFNHLLLQPQQRQSRQSHRYRDERPEKDLSAKVLLPSPFHMHPQDLLSHMTGSVAHLLTSRLSHKRHSHPNRSATNRRCLYIVTSS